MLDMDANVGYPKCRSCGAEIIWLETAAGKAMPCDLVGINPDSRLFDPKVHRSHFATCPNANQHRRPR